MRVSRVFVLVLTLVMAGGVLEASAADCLLPPTLSMIAPAVGIAGTALNISITVKPTTGGRNCAIRSWTLAYGDGQTKTGTNKGTFVYTHTYATDATFTIQLSATTRGGKYAAITRTIVISVAPLPSFVVTCPSPITVASPDGTPVSVSYTATTTGGTDPITISYTPPSGSSFVVGRTTVTVDANSNNGQQSSCTFPVTVTYTVPPAGTIFYISPTGDDTKTCTQAQSILTPRKTIAQGVACLGPGARLLMRGGTYTSTGATVVVPSGVSWEAATWIGRYSSEQVILAGNPFKTLSASVAYVIFDGFIIDGGAQRVDGVSVGSGSDHLRFNNIELRNVASNGFTITDNDVQIINCYIHDGGTTDFDHAIYISGNASSVAHNTIVTGTTITKWAGAGIQLFAPGFPVDDVIISGNTIYNTSAGVAGTTNTNTGGYTNGFSTQGISVQDANRTLVYNNLIYALRVRTAPRYAILAGNASSGTKIMNNTVANNPTEGIELYATTGSTLVVNNLLSANALGNVVNVASGVTFTTNVCQVSGTGCTAGLVGAPAFVNETVGDYHIQSASKAYNAGTTQTDFTTDKDGVSRPQDGTWDVGAYESTGTTYYVSTTGSDANSCAASKNVATPKRNVTGVAGGLACVSAGQRLVLRGGSYPEAITPVDQTLPTGTSWTNAITIEGFAGETAILKSINLQDNIDLSVVAYWVINNLTLDGGGSGAQITNTGNVVRFAGNTHHVRVQNSEIRNANDNVIFSTETVGFVEILNNNIHHAFVSLFGGNHPTTGNYGMYVKFHNSVIDGNIIHDNTGYGMHMYGSGLSTVSDNIIRNNKFYNNALDDGERGNLAGSALVATGSNNLFYNNLIYGSTSAGHGAALSTTSSSNNKFYNNVVYGNNGIGIEVNTSAANTTVRNNIVFGNTTATIVDWGASGLVSNTNLCNNASTGCTSTANPLFINAASNDFRLQAGSPGVNTGATISVVPLDFLGVVRPQGSAYDIGAYER